MSESNWPEQDAIDKWWREHSLALKTAATQCRIDQDRKVERLREALWEIRGWREIGSADTHTEKLKAIEAICDRALGDTS